MKDFAITVFYFTGEKWTSFSCFLVGWPYYCFILKGDVNAWGCVYPRGLVWGLLDVMGVRWALRTKLKY